MREKKQQFGFRLGPTQTGLYSHRRWLEAGNVGFRKKRNCTICDAKTKALISFAVTAKLICATAKLICAFVFAYAATQMIRSLRGDSCTRELYLYLPLICKKGNANRLKSWCGPRNPRWPSRWQLKVYLRMAVSHSMRKLLSNLCS